MTKNKRAAPGNRGGQKVCNADKRRNYTPGTVFRHRRVPSSWWHDRDFMEMSWGAKSLLLALWTSPVTPTCGIVVTTMNQISDATGLSLRTIRQHIAELEIAGFLQAHQIGSQHVIWLDGFIDVQLGAEPAANQKWMASTLKALAGFPESPIIDRYKKRYRLDGVSDGVWHGVSDGAPMRYGMGYGIPSSSSCSLRYEGKLDPDAAAADADAEVQP